MYKVPKGCSVYEREPRGLMAMSRAQVELAWGRQSPMRLKRNQVGGWRRSWWEQRVALLLVRLQDGLGRGEERSGAFRYEAVWSPGQGTSCARATLPALALPVIPLPPNATGPLMSLTWHCSVLHVSLSLPGVGCSGMPWAGCPGPAVLWAALAPWEGFLAPKGAGSIDLFIQRLN